MLRPRNRKGLRLSPLFLIRGLDPKPWRALMGQERRASVGTAHPRAALWVGMLPEKTPPSSRERAVVLCSFSPTCLAWNQSPDVPLAPCPCPGALSTLSPVWTPGVGARGPCCHGNFMSLYRD